MTKKEILNKQRITGIIMLLLTVILMGLFRGDVTYAFFTIPVGLLLTLSKSPIFYGYKDVIDEDEES